MMKVYLFKGLVIGLVVGGLFGWWYAGKNVPGLPMMSGSPTWSAKQAGLNMTMRQLWEEHTWWTREYLKSAITGAKDTNNVAARLLKNQDDIGNSIKPFYGDAAGSALTALLHTHIQGAVDLVAAAKSGNKAKFDTANTAWYANADEIAMFLANANPNWPLADVTKMMHDHLDLTKQEAVDIMNKNYDASIADFDQVETEILMMSDNLSAGIVKQFPNQF